MNAVTIKIALMCVESWLLDLSLWRWWNVHLGDCNLYQKWIEFKPLWDIQPLRMLNLTGKSVYNHLDYYPICLRAQPGFKGSWSGFGLGIWLGFGIRGNKNFWHFVLDKMGKYIKECRASALKHDDAPLFASTVDVSCCTWQAEPGTWCAALWVSPADAGGWTEILWLWCSHSSRRTGVSRS